MTEDEFVEACQDAKTEILNKLQEMESTDDCDVMLPALVWVVTEMAMFVDFGKDELLKSVKNCWAALEKIHTLPERN